MEGLVIHWTGLRVALQYIGMTRNNLYIISISLGTRGFVKNGDKIHLLNQFQTKSYLDTYVGLKGKYELQTSTSPNRDSGSGTWEIVLEGCINQKGKIWEKAYFVYHFLVNCNGKEETVNIYYSPQSKSFVLLGGCSN